MAAAKSTSGNGAMALGSNVQGTLDGHILTLTIDLSAKGSPSKSGKTQIKATTHGAARVNGNTFLNVNVYDRA